MQVPVACFSSLILTFFKHFVCLFFFCFFFKVNSGVFLHSRMATLLQATAKSYLQHARATREELWRWSLNESYSTNRWDTVLRSEIPSGKCAKLRTVAASNNRDHPTRSLSSSPLASTINCSPGSQALL